MRLLITVLILFISHICHAKICLEDAKKAQISGTNHLVISFEGLMSYGAGFVRKSLIKNLTANPQYKFYSKNLSYTSTQKALECINDWEQVFKTQYQLTIIGHSFGGGIATFKLLNLLHNVYVDTVITLDPRSWSTDSKYAKNKSLFQFETQKNVGQFLNFYQRGSMPGYKVLGALNFELKNTSHTKVPAHPLVYNKIVCQLFDEC